VKIADDSEVCNYVCGCRPMMLDARATKTRRLIDGARC